MRETDDDVVGGLLSDSISSVGERTLVLSFIPKLYLRYGFMPRPGFRLILKTAWVYSGL